MTTGLNLPFTFRKACEELMTKGLIINWDNLLNAVRNSIPEFEISHELQEWYANIIEWKFLKCVIEKQDWQEIAIHGPAFGQVITHNKTSSFKFGPFDSEDYQLLLEILAYRQNITWNHAMPFASFMFNQDSNLLRATLLHAITMPTYSSKLFLRCPPRFKINLNDFLINIAHRELLTNLMLEKKNLIISGGTGCGKTTLLRSLMQLIPEDEHIVTVEDLIEINHQSPFNSAMISHGDSIQMRNFMAWSLRISPKRIILGEIRSEEIIPYFLALNTGHKGVMATIHASSAQEVPERLALLYGLYHPQSSTPWHSLMKLICKNIEYVIHMENKKIMQIIKLNGSDGEIPFFEEIYSNSGV